MSEHALEVGMSFRGGRAVFFNRHREGMIYPLGFEKRHVVDGEVVGGGGGPAYFQEHLWSTELANYAAGMVKQPHFMDSEGYVLDPSCLPIEALAIWPTLDRAAKQKLCLGLINGENPAVLAASFPKPEPQLVTADPEVTAEAIKCPVCNLAVEGETNPDKARAAILVHQRMMHPDWQGH